MVGYANGEDISTGVSSLSKSIRSPTHHNQHGPHNFNRNPWLAASPDDYVYDEKSSPQLGLDEYKNQYSVRNLTVEQACKYHPFAWEKSGES